MNSFEHILSPVSPAGFLHEHFEKNYLHIPRNNSEWYSGILTAEEISAFLDRQDVFYPSLRIVKNGKEIPNGDYTLKATPIGHHRKDGIINTDKAFALFNDGATFVIQAGQRYFNNLSLFCHHLSMFFQAPVQANLYITPHRSVGFNPHWDTHEVMVLQIAGTKTWHLYGFGKELPVKSQPSSVKELNTENRNTLQLSPGDLLYLPRGYVHDAVADDGISAHITIGILNYTWLNLFQNAFGQLADQKEFRESIPFWEKGVSEKLEQKIEMFAERLREIDFAKEMMGLSAAYKRIQPMPVRHYFQSLLRLNHLHKHSILSVNKGLFIQEGRENGHIMLILPGKKVEMPEGAVEAWKFMQSKDQFTFDEIPLDDDEEPKAIFIQKLIKEGILFLVE